MSGGQIIQSNPNTKRNTNWTKNHMYSSYKFLERCPLYFQIVLNLVEWPMIHGLRVVEGCTEGIRFGAWKGWSVVALKGQEKAGEEKVWVDLRPPLRSMIPHYTMQYQGLGRSQATSWKSGQISGLPCGGSSSQPRGEHCW